MAAKQNTLKGVRTLSLTETGHGSRTSYNLNIEYADERTVVTEIGAGAYRALEATFTAIHNIRGDI
jgi:sugar/nucleoside kinase (ribokinase family)